MSRSPFRSWRKPLTGLVFSLLLVWMAACSPTPAPPSPTATRTVTPTPLPTFTASPSLTPTVSRTPNPSPTPTIAPSVTPTPTQTRPPTLTAAVPLVDNDRYDLVNWTSARASQMVELMQTYPDVLYPENKRQGNANYYNLFTFAALAQSEALLRFPTSQQADRWRWELGYNLARSSEPSAGEYYAGLIRGALNQGQTRPENLNEWFAQSERRMVLRPVVLEPVPGSISTTLIELQASGDAFLLLLETPRDFQAFSLASNFDFVNPVDYDFAVGDLTGDGSPEIILYPVTSAEGRTPPPVEVFDLSTSPPQGLNFRPTDRIAIGLDHVNRWTPIPLLSGRTNLQYTTTIFPPCPLEIKTQYHWDGTWFNAVDRTFRLQPDPELLSFCDTLLSHALIHWGPQVSSRLIESALEAVPAGETESALTAEMLDDWRFRLGVAYALAGDRPAAVAHLEDLIADPRGTEANSHSMAEEFLEIYETGAGLYVACEATPGCDPAMALERVIESLPLAEYPAVISQLVLARVPVRQSGFFDFDGDGETERWITVRPRGRLDLDFWILVRAPGRIDALLVDSVPGVNPDLSLVETPAGARVFQLGFQNSFSLDRLADTREPYLNRYQPELVLTSQLVQQQNKDALDRLLGGVDARQIRDELSRLQASPVFGCTFGTCPDFIYPLALAHELAGDERKAVDLYLELWRVYTKSPYTIMARLKLVGEALVPTETPTPTPTSTPTRTPTVTGTLPTATATQSVTPATSTPTGTVLPSPYP